MLPIGSDVPQQSPLRVYCPSCNEIYFPRNSKLENIDGAFFGSSASLVLCMTKPIPQTLKAMEHSELKLFGFRVAIPKPKKDKLSCALADGTLALGIGAPQVTENIIDSDST